MTDLHCGRCGALRDVGDNFCRQCGHQLTVNLPAAQAGLPAIRPPTLPVRPKTIPPPLVSSVAVLAVGTGLEWLARRLAGNAARAAGRALIGRERSPVRPVENASGPLAGDLTIDELLYVRKVQLRR